MKRIKETVFIITIFSLLFVFAGCKDKMVLPPIQPNMYILTITPANAAEGAFFVQADGAVLVSGTEVKENATVILTATPVPGYVFLGFRVNGAPYGGTANGLSHTHNFIMTRDTSVAAEFGVESNYWNLDITPPNPAEGSLVARVDGIEVTVQVEKNKTVVFTATPVYGYKFLYFMVNGIDENGTPNGIGGYIYELIMTAAASVSAVFQEADIEPAVIFLWNTERAPTSGSAVFASLSSMPSGFGNIDFRFFYTGVYALNSGFRLTNATHLAIGCTESTFTTAANHVPGVFDFSQGTFRLTVDYNSPTPGGSYMLRFAVNNNDPGNTNSVLGQPSTLRQYDNVAALQNGIGQNSAFTVNDAGTENGKLILTFRPSAFYSGNSGISSLKNAFIALACHGSSSINITGIKLEWLDPVLLDIIAPAQTPGGTIFIDPQMAAKGTIVTITAIPDEHFKLDSFTVNGSSAGLTITGNIITFMMPDEIVTIAASFKEILPDEYAITVDPLMANGAIIPNKTQAPEDAIVTLTVTPDAGYIADRITIEPELAGVIVKEESNGTYTFVMPDTAITVKAVFVPVLLFKWDNVTAPVTYYTNTETRTGSIYANIPVSMPVGSGFGDIDFRSIGGSPEIQPIVNGAFRIGDDRRLTVGSKAHTATTATAHVPGSFDLSSGTFRLNLKYDDPRDGTGSYMFRVLLNNNTGAGATTVLGGDCNIYETTFATLGDSGSKGTGVTFTGDTVNQEITITFTPEDRFAALKTSNLTYYNSLQTAFFTIASLGTDRLIIKGIELKKIDAGTEATLETLFAWDSDTYPMSACLPMNTPVVKGTSDYDITPDFRIIALSGGMGLSSDGMFRLGVDRKLVVGSTSNTHTETDTNTHVPGVFDYSRGTFRLTLDYRNPTITTGTFLLRVLINNNEGGVVNSVIKNDLSVIRSYINVANLQNGMGPNASASLNDKEGTVPGTLVVTFTPSEMFKGNAGAYSLTNAFFAFTCQSTSALTVSGIKLERIK